MPIFFARSPEIAPTHQIVGEKTADEDADGNISMNAIYIGFSRLVDSFMTAGILRRRNESGEDTFLLVNGEDLDGGTYDNLMPEEDDDNQS